MNHWSDDPLVGCTTTTIEKKHCKYDIYYQIIAVFLWEIATFTLKSSVKNTCGSYVFPLPLQIGPQFCFNLCLRNAIAPTHSWDLIAPTPNWSGSWSKLRMS